MSDNTKMKKDDFEFPSKWQIAGALFIAQIKGVFFSGFFYMLSGFVLRGDEGLNSIGILNTMISITAVSIVFSPFSIVGSFLMGFPAFFLGVFASEALILRGIVNPVIWIITSTVIGGSWMFFHLPNYTELIYFSIISASFIGFFMSRYARRVLA